MPSIYHKLLYRLFSAHDRVQPARDAPIAESSLSYEEQEGPDDAESVVVLPFYLPNQRRTDTVRGIIALLSWSAAQGVEERKRSTISSVFTERAHSQVCHGCVEYRGLLNDPGDCCHLRWGAHGRLVSGFSGVLPGVLRGLAIRV
jgi:hypothetical protein